MISLFRRLYYGFERQHLNHRAQDEIERLEEFAGRQQAANIVVAVLPVAHIGHTDPWVSQIVVHLQRIESN